MLALDRTIDRLNAAVRPLVTVMVTAVLCIGFMTERIGAEAFLSVASVIVTFWFSQRQAFKDSAPGPTEPTK